MCEAVSERRRRFEGLAVRYETARAELGRLRPELATPDFPTVDTIGHLDAAEAERVEGYWNRLVAEVEWLARAPQEPTEDRSRRQVHQRLVDKIAIAVGPPRRDLLGEY